MSMLRAEVSCVWPARALLGEGPCWDKQSGLLFWTDIKGRQVHSYEPRTGARRTWAAPTRICSLDRAPPDWRPPSSEADWFVGCTESAFAWIGLGQSSVDVRVLAQPELDQPNNRFNDGKIGPDGRYWAGTMDDAEIEVSGALYAFSADGGWDRVDTDYKVTNGPAFSPDGRALYHTDSARRVIYRFELSRDGRASNKQTFIRFTDSEGYPDGMTTDREGNLWVAMWDGGRVQKLSKNGERIGALTIPTPRPTSCVFVDEVCKELYITSAAIDADPADQFAGGLFKAQLGGL